MVELGCDGQDGGEEQCGARPHKVGGVQYRIEDTINGVKALEKATRRFGELKTNPADIVGRKGAYMGNRYQTSSMEISPRSTGSTSGPVSGECFGLAVLK